ncbi:unnamed protein product [Adineta ricciae]|uniref:Uncharacterized protein n=2 Tax=Adineta ricciae TaxID=249248 RepID=A0A814MSB9_ADIRI|nr:unnamed protein product [Adineta ricciae]
MKLSLVLLFISVYLCHTSDIWYQADMSTTLVPPFQNVYTTLQQTLISRLSTLNGDSLPTDEPTLTSITSMFYCEVEKLVKNLDLTLLASNNIRIKVDQKLASIMNEIKAKENEIARMNGQIQDVNGKIQAKQSQISTAEQSVRQAENSVNEAQNALQRAEKEVEEAQKCSGLFGRRKRFLGNIWNSIQSVVNDAGNAISSAVNQAGNAIGSVVNQAGGAIESAANTVGNAIVDNVVKPVCSVINFQQVDNARRNVENKRNELVNYRSQVQSLKNDLNSMQNDLVVYSAQLYNLNYQLTQLQNSLVALPNEQHIILSINQKLSSVASTVQLALNNAGSFPNGLMTMIDFDSIVKPLNAVYDELQQNQFMTSFSIAKLSGQEVNQAKTGLQVLIDSMLNFPFNANNARCSK